MSTNLHLYTKVKERIRQWQPKERVTRQRNMALLIVGLFLSKAIHLSLIVRKWPSASKELSLVNRLRRFLDNPHVKVREWYEPIAGDLLAYCAKERVRLIIDTTKVGFGYRLMTIGLAYRSRTLPLVWSAHRGAKGHTAVSDQIALFEAIRHWVPEEAKVWVMGDTEFESPRLLEWIQAQGWHFVIRQRGSIKVRQPGQPWMNINQFALSPGQTRVIGWVHLTEKYATTPIWLILHWEKGEDEPWYLVSDCLGERRLLQLYRTRMWIEEMYGDLKATALISKPLSWTIQTGFLVFFSQFAWPLSGSSLWAVAWSNVDGVILLTPSPVATKVTSVSAGTGLNVVYDSMSPFQSLFYPILESDVWLDTKSVIPK